MNKLQVYFFTFSAHHPLSDQWIEIHAPTREQARDKMFDLFGTTWASQYTTENFDHKYFPSGRSGKIIRVID